MTDVFDHPGPFKVGDVVKVVKTRFHHDLLGAVLTITGPLQLRAHKNGVAETHPTDLVHEGVPIFAPPDSVRGRRPPTTGEESVLAMFKGQPQTVPA